MKAAEPESSTQAERLVDQIAASVLSGEFQPGLISTRLRSMPSGTHIAEEAGGVISSRTGSSSPTSLIHAAIPFRMSSAKLCSEWRRSPEATTSCRKTS
jgi:hypothetical protein